MSKDSDLIIGYCLMALSAMGPTSDNQKRLYIEKLYTLFDEISDEEARQYYKDYLKRKLELKKKFAAGARA